MTISGIETEVKAGSAFSNVSKSISGNDFSKLIGRQMRKKAPYSNLADEKGMIEYEGCLFTCDFEKNTLNLGDTSNKKNCISIPLEDGGTLVVNRDNLGDLSKSMSMFSAKDVGTILRAIAQDKKLQEIQMELDDNEILSAEERLDRQAEAIFRKMIDGDTDPKFQIGASVLSEKEWDELLSYIDEYEEKYSEDLQEETEEKYKEALKEESREKIQ